MKTDEIQAILGRTPGVADWETRAARKRETQLYVIKGETENLRRVGTENVGVTVYNDHGGSRGAASFGLPPADDGEAVARRAAEGAYMASLASNPPWPLPGPAAYPSPQVYDPTLAAEGAPAELDRLKERLLAAVAAEKGVRLSAAEFFATETESGFANSRGAAVTERSTGFFSEFILLAGTGGGAAEAENYYQLSRHRLADVPIEEIVAGRARMAIDGIGATAPPTGRMPVVVSGEDVTRFFGPFVFALSGEAIYRKLSTFKGGDALLGERPIKGDRLTLVSDGLLPFGARTSAVAPDGLPMTRTTLIQDGVVANLLCDQQYATYLNVPAAGGPGNLVVTGSKGAASMADLLRPDGGPFLHVVAFTALFPDPIRGDFFAEIRLAYLHEGDRVRPVKGGSVAGNVYDAFADARFSREEAFHGHYLGPRAIRFGSLTVAGD